MQNRRLKNLACAVVYQAVMDWKWARRTIDRLVDPDTESKKERLAKAHRLLIDTEAFFLGDDFCIFSDLDGKKLLEVEYGEGCMSAEVVAALEAIGYGVNKYSGRNLYFGGVQGIKFNYDEYGRLVSMTGGADPRRDGKALAW